MCAAAVHYRRRFGCLKRKKAACTEPTIAAALLLPFGSAFSKFGSKSRLQLEPNVTCIRTNANTLTVNSIIPDAIILFCLLSNQKRIFTPVIILFNRPRLGARSMQRLRWILGMASPTGLRPDPGLVQQRFPREIWENYR